MNKAVQEAIERGQKKHAEEQEEKRLAAEKKREEERIAHEKWKADTLACCHAWIKDKLPTLLEREAGLGHDKITFNSYYKPTELENWGDEALALLMPLLVTEAGLKATATRHWVEPVNDDGMHWEGHYSYNFEIRW